MIHTIQVNKTNKTEHIIHLDQHLPINIKTLPPNVAYKIQDTPIHTTTTQTLQENTLQQIRQKNKHIRQKTILIIIQNTKHTPKTRIQTIKENPLITIHHTTPEKLTQTLQKLLQTQTPTTNKPIHTKNNTLYHDNKAIKIYKNNEYLQYIQQTLTQKPTQTLQQAEYQAQKTYYKHITYDKTNHNYKLTLKQKTISNHKKLTHALQEKQLQLTRQEQDEETLCHTNNTKTTTLPPTPWNNPLHNMKKDHQKYLTQHQTYHNNPDTITHLHQNNTPRQTILNTQKPDRNITQIKNTYHIIKTKNKKTTTYHTTKDKNEARYIRDQLEQNNYKQKDITHYQIRYQYNKKEYQTKYNNKYHIIDYYQQTTPKLTTHPDTKEEYQQQQIQTTQTINNNIKNKYLKNFRAPSRSWEQ